MVEILIHLPKPELSQSLGNQEAILQREASAGISSEWPSNLGMQRGEHLGHSSAKGIAVPVQAGSIQELISPELGHRRVITRPVRGHKVARNLILGAWLGQDYIGCSHTTLPTVRVADRNNRKSPFLKQCPSSTLY